MINIYFIFLIGLFHLVLFAHTDIKTKRLANVEIIIFLILGLILSLINNNILLDGLGMVLMVLFAYTLWQFKSFGGADAKLLIALVPFLVINSILEIVHFMFLLSMVSMVVVFSIKRKIKKIKKIPFIPVITATYILFWILRFIFFSFY